MNWTSSFRRDVCSKWRGAEPATSAHIWTDWPEWWAHHSSAGWSTAKQTEDPADDDWRIQQSRWELTARLSQVNSFFFSFLFVFVLAHLPYLILASRMKSMLQELDSNVISKENVILEQNGRLAEKDKVMHSNKMEIERLEKKTKMQEHKVLLWLIIPGLLWYYWFVVFLTLSRLPSRLTSCRKRLKSMKTTSVPCSKRWKPGGTGCRESFLRRDAWSSACRAWSRTHSISGRKSV